MQKVVNINVGVLGHVDSGKTSLVAALSDVLSVAALDKHPQSRERGITLDIGLSAFQVRSSTSNDVHNAELRHVVVFVTVSCVYIVLACVRIRDIRLGRHSI